MSLISLLSILSCKGYDNLTVEKFSAAIDSDPDAVLLDVRTPDEFSDGHIPGAVNIDVNSAGFKEEAAAAMAPGSKVLVYCRSGRRSAVAAKTLDRLGFKVTNLEGGIIAWTQAGKPVTRYEVETFLTDSGKPVKITLIKHGSLEISYSGKSIQIDPVAAYGKKTDYSAEFPKADFILVTHEHPDHLEASTIDTLSCGATRLILNGTSHSIIGKGEVIANGETTLLDLGSGESILLEAVPAYNTTPGREKFHPKGNGNGYVFNIDGLRIYVAGDTEPVPEMAALKDIDVAFLPVNQPFTMTVDQCVDAARTIRPKVLIPYHFSKTDISSLPEMLPDIDVRLRQMQ